MKITYKLHPSVGRIIYLFVFSFSFFVRAEQNNNLIKGQVKEQASTWYNWLSLTIDFCKEKNNCTTSEICKNNFIHWKADCKTCPIGTVKVSGNACSACNCDDRSCYAENPKCLCHGGYGISKEDFIYWYLNFLYLAIYVILFLFYR